MAKVTVKVKKGSGTQPRKKIRELGEQLDLNESLNSLVAAMHDFEAKYGMSTLEFYVRFVAGKMGDSRDFIKWAGSFDLYQNLLNTHFHQNSKAV
ncbi:MAG: hypothetical protein AB1757_00840 [Acidobacteriota bacterium]